MDFIIEDPKDCAVLNEQRRREIAELIENRQPFPAEVTWFNHQPILLPRTVSPDHRKADEVWIEPVAFRPNHDKFAILAPGGAPLGMEACLAVHPNGSLMRRDGGGWTFIDDDLSWDELRRLRVGVQGDSDLLMKEHVIALGESLQTATGALIGSPSLWPFGR